MYPGNDGTPHAAARRELLADRIHQQVPFAEIVQFSDDPFAIARAHRSPCQFGDLSTGGQSERAGQKRPRRAWGLTALVRRARNAGRIRRLVEGFDLILVPEACRLEDKEGGCWGVPSGLFLWAAFAKAAGVPFALLGVGMGEICHPLSRWFFRRALAMASICLFQDDESRTALWEKGARDRGSSQAATPLQEGDWSVLDAALTLAIKGGSAAWEPAHETSKTRAVLRTEEAPLVSVVTPVYNGEKFLDGAIQSVLMQDYPFWDYVIVNNRSTDRTLEIAEGYAKRDGRIRVVTNEVFVNAEQNHNLAFRQVAPDARYCKAVSADDRLLPGCLSRMVSFALAHPGAGIIGSYQQSGTEIRWRGLPRETEILSGREICRLALLEGIYVFGNPTSSLYRADLLRGPAPFFPHSAPHADTSACYAWLRDCDFGFVHEVLTQEGVHAGQISCQVDELGWGVSACLESVFSYGPVYLSEAEYRARLGELLSDYYRYLGGSLLKFRSGGFWRFHRERLREFGLRLNWERVALEALLEARLEAMRPLEAWRKLRDYLRKNGMAYSLMSGAKSGGVSALLGLLGGL